MNLNSLPIFYSSYDLARADLSAGTDFTMQNKSSIAEESCQRSSQYMVKHSTPRDTEGVYSGTDRSSLPLQTQPNKPIFSSMNLILNQDVSLPSKVVESPTS